jgi:hypothetical protein
MPASKIDIANQLDLDLSDYGAAQDTITLGSGGYSTISIDPSIYSTFGTSITSPTTYTWSQDYNTSWSNTASVNIDTNGINIKEGGDIKIGDKSLSDAIEKIEERLGILNPNPELEERWDQLKELRKQYMELEKDLLEKEKLMKILKEK